jgi:hypothetical protein
MSYRYSRQLRSGRKRIRGASKQQQQDEEQQQQQQEGEEQAGREAWNSGDNGRNRTGQHTCSWATGSVVVSVVVSVDSGAVDSGAVDSGSATVMVSEE